MVETGELVSPVDEASWADLRAPDVVDRYAEFVAWTGYVPRNRELGAVARELRKGRRPAEAVLAVSEWVHDKLTYQRGTTGVHSSAVDAWHAREGVCQDYAHLTLALLRSIGIPGRYVSGYLHTKPNAKVGETVAARATRGSRRGPAAGGASTRPTTSRSGRGTSGWRSAGTTRTCRR